MSDTSEFSGSHEEYMRLMPAAEEIVDKIVGIPSNGQQIADRYNNKAAVIRILHKHEIKNNNNHNHGRGNN